MVALDTLVPGEGGASCARPGLEWLAAALGASAPRPTVIVMHHPPFPGECPHGSARAAQCRALRGHRGQAEVERILCGHLHRSIQVRVGGTIASTAPSTAHQVTLDLRPEAPSTFTMEPPGFQLHLWQPGQGLISHTAVIGDFAGPIRSSRTALIV